MSCRSLISGPPTGAASFSYISRRLPDPGISCSVFRTRINKHLTRKLWKSNIHGYFPGHSSHPTIYGSRESKLS